MPETHPDVDRYLDSLPEDRRDAMRQVRNAVVEALPEGYVERMAGNMVAYVVPLDRYPAGYHCNPKQPLMIAALGNGKAACSLHLVGIYWNPEAHRRLVDSHSAQGKQLDIGKGCIRFKRASDLDLDAVREAVAAVSVERFIEINEAARARKKGQRKSSLAPDE